MSDIEDIANSEFNELLEHFDLGELYAVESSTDGQDMSKELLGIVTATTDDALSTSGIAQLWWEVRRTAFGNGIVLGVLSFLFVIGVTPTHS